MDRRTFFGIQVLRGVAAVAVICVHLTGTLTNGGELTYLPVFFPGNAGVDLFFLISGFVIAWTTRDVWHQAGYWRLFLNKKLLRIIPLYWLLSAAKLLLVISVPFLFRAPPPSAIDVVRSFLFLPVWDAAGNNTMLITAGWTLCYEMAFYYLITVCLARQWRPIVTAGPILVVLGVVGAFRSVQWGALASLIDPLLLEFVAGMAIAELTRRGAVRHGLATSVALLGIGACLWFLTGLVPDKEAMAWRVLVWGLPMALILYAGVSIEPWLNPRKLWLPLLIGDASYSIYLTDVLILPLPSRLAALRLDLSIWEGLALLATLVVFGLASGILTWWLVERRLIVGGMAMLKRQFTRPTRANPLRRTSKLVLPSQADGRASTDEPVQNNSPTPRDAVRPGW